MDEKNLEHFTGRIDNIWKKDPEKDHYNVTFEKDNRWFNGFDSTEEHEMWEFLNASFNQGKDVTIGFTDNERDGRVFYNIQEAKLPEGQEKLEKGEKKKTEPKKKKEEPKKAKKTEAKKVEKEQPKQAFQPADQISTIDRIIAGNTLTLNKCFQAFEESRGHEAKSEAELEMVMFLAKATLCQANSLKFASLS